MVCYRRYRSNKSTLILKFNATENDGENDLLQYLEVYKHKLHEA